MLKLVLALVFASLTLASCGEDAVSTDASANQDMAVDGATAD